MPEHKSHVTRFSDASSYDYICVNCGAADNPMGGKTALDDPCPKPVGQGGITYEEWLVKDQERIARLKESIKKSTEPTI